MTFSRSLGGVLLHGGYGMTAPGQSYLWNGGNWTWLGDGDPVREGHAMELDVATDRMVVFGGWNYFAGHSSNTWLFSTNAPASYTTFGSGSGGPAGAPQLAPLGSNLPWIGDKSRIVAAPMPTFGFFAFGVSNTMWGGVALPFSLAVIGMPGCDLLVSGETVLGMAPINQAATYTLTIPYEPTLVGTESYVQALSLDLGANPTGLTVSNGLMLRMGWL